MSAHNTSSVHWQTAAIARTSSSTSSALAPTTTIMGRTADIGSSSTACLVSSRTACLVASPTRSSTPTRPSYASPSRPSYAAPKRPSYAAPRAPDPDLVRLLADARSAIVCPPQDARSAIARPPQDADAPDGYFAGYCAVM
ncbi:hypothetical protein GGG16DRAFT_114966 [Schizophyllum commune]